MARTHQVDGQEKIVSPEEVAAAILSYLKKIAEDFIGRPVTKVCARVHVCTDVCVCARARGGAGNAGKSV